MLARGAWPASSEATARLALRSGTPAGRCPAAASCRVSTPGPGCSVSSVTGVTLRARRSPVAPADQQVDGGHVGDDREGEQLSDRDVLPPGYLQVGRIYRLMGCFPWMASRWARSRALQPGRSRSSRMRAYGRAPADASRRWRTGDGRCEANRLHGPDGRTRVRSETAWSSPTMSTRITLRPRRALVRPGILSSNQGGISLAKSDAYKGCRE